MSSYQEKSGTSTPANEAALSPDLSRTQSPNKNTYSGDISGTLEKRRNELDVETSSQNDLKRELSSRHLQFLAIGGTIGTGLFLGTGPALSTAGPLGTLIAFTFMGTIVYSVMVSLGEMATFVPVTGSFTVYASRFVDPSLGFAMGWLYWLSWAITYAFELFIAGQVIQYWNDSINLGVWVAVFWVIFTATNYLPVKFFGESEMYFASIKVITIIGFLVYGICMNAGVGQEGYLGFKYWKDPGVFAEYLYEGSLGKFVGFWGVLITAAFSFQGTELVGVGAGETANPRKNVPHAIRWTFWGIFTLFIGTVFFLGILVPSNDERLTLGEKNASASPLVIATIRAGVRILPDIINAVLLTAILSAANSNVYSASRIMVALANEGCCPKVVTRTNRWGIPYVSVSIAAAVGLIAFVACGAAADEVFDWLIGIIGVAGLITWGCINYSHIRFQKALQVQGIDREVEMPYLAPFQPWFAWYGLFFITLITLTQGFEAFVPKWDIVNFFLFYISLMIFVVLWIGHKIAYRTRFVPLHKVDLVKGTRHL